MLPSIHTLFNEQSDRCRNLLTAVALSKQYTMGKNKTHPILACFIDSEEDCENVSQLFTFRKVERLIINQIKSFDDGKTAALLFTNTVMTAVKYDMQAGFRFETNYIHRDDLEYDFLEIVADEIRKATKIAKLSDKVSQVQFLGHLKQEVEFRMKSIATDFEHVTTMKFIREREPL